MSEDMTSLDRRGLARGLKIFLDIMFYLAVLVGALWLVSLPISAFTDYDDGWEGRFPAAIGEGSLYPRLDVEVDQTASPGLEYIRVVGAQGQIRFLHHSLPLHLGYSAVFFIFWVVFLWAITLLRRILATTGGGRPFDPLNPKRLNTLGWIIVSASVLTSLFQHLASKWVLSRVEVVTIPLSPSTQIHEEWIICGLLVLVLAAIWKEAVRMAEEQSLTV